MDDMTDNTTKDLQDDHIKSVVEDWFTGSGFTARKLTDTPTDVLQVVNKKYVDTQISSAVAGSVYGRMYLNGVQSVVANSPTYEKVNFDTSSFSGGIGIDTTNHRFVTSVAGVFRVTAAVQYEQPNTAGTVCSAAIYVNSSVKAVSWSHVAVVNLNISPSVSDIVSLNVNDFVEIYTTKSTAITDGLLQSGTAQTYASIDKI